MSDFDLRKFLAEQKAAKVETVKEEEAVEEAKHENEMEEAHGHEKEMEETYHEGEEMEEGDMDESVIAGVAALIGTSLAAGKVLDYIKKKYPEATEKFVKAAAAAERGSGKSGSGGSYITQEGEAHDGKEMEEEIKENTFKSSIKDILNS